MAEEMYTQENTNCGPCFVQKTIGCSDLNRNDLTLARQSFMITWDMNSDDLLYCNISDTMSYSKPEQMSDQEFYISVQQGGTAALPCRVQSTPPPTLRLGDPLLSLLSGLCC